MRKISAQVKQKFLIWYLLEEAFCSLKDVELDTVFSPIKVENDDVIAVLDVDLL